MLNEYREMLLNSAKEVYKVINKPKFTNENKMLIASANTLAQTTKTALQLELLEYRKVNASNNINALIDKIGD